MSGTKGDPEARFRAIAHDLEFIGDVIRYASKHSENESDQLVMKAWLRLQFNVGYVCGENDQLRASSASRPEPAAAPAPGLRPCSDQAVELRAELKRYRDREAALPELANALKRWSNVTTADELVRLHRAVEAFRAFKVTD